MKQPAFSVVIPVRGGITSFTMCLKHVVEKSPTDTEVIVVVNGEAGEDDNGVVAFCQSRFVGPLAARCQVFDLRGQQPAGFATAANYGLARTTGKYMVTLHDDVFVTKGWLEGLRTGLRLAAITVKSAKFGYIGPVSNMAHGQQNVTEKVGSAAPIADANAAEEVATTLRRADASDIVVGGSLDSFCLMMTREAYENVGGFDERLNPAGFEDQELLIRAQSKGYLGVISPRVFVFHVGRQTTPQHACTQFGDYKNQETYLRIARERPKCTRLGVGILATLFTEQDEKDLVHQITAVVRQIQPTTICLLDLRSTRSIPDLLKQHGLWEHIGSFQRVEIHTSSKEVRERNQLLNMVRSTTPDWILLLEQNHFPSKKVTPTVINNLMNPVDPLTKGYRYSVYTLWNTEEQMRLDKPFGQRFDQQFFKNEPWGDYEEPNRPEQEIEFATPTAMPGENIPYTHQLTMVDPSFLHLDNVKEHGVSYSTRQLTTCPRVEPTFTYLLMVKNEAHEMATLISRFKDWADDFVVVDTGSTDRTVEICEGLGVPVIHFACCEKSLDPEHLLCDYGAARNFCVQQCSTDYILFMDADETIAPKDFMLIPFVLLENCDAYICSINNWMQSGVRPMKYITYQARLFKKRPEIYFAPEIHETLEECLKLNNSKLEVVRCDMLVEHFGYLRQTPAERQTKSVMYEERLLKCIEKDPNDVRSVFALGQHFNANSKYDQGDSLISKALSMDQSFFSARQEMAFRLMRRAQDLLIACPKSTIPSPIHEKMMRDVIASLAPWTGLATR